VTLRPGKLAPDLLGSLLSRVPIADPRVVLGPGIGRDAAVIDLGERMIVLKSDPVTFATERIGWYAVHVNANDVACMGARPAWFLATVLLPEGCPADLPGRIFDDVAAACRALRVDVVGGHTEITIGLDRPIVAGSMIGEAAPHEIIAGAGIAAGDAILLAGQIAVEGTALLAIDAADRLSRHGVGAAVVESARRLLDDPGISVVAAARAICAGTKPRLLHDPTEGGVSTAFYEMAAAAGATLRVRAEALSPSPITGEICAALGLDPLGLLSSGALLAIVPAAGADAAVTVCHQHAIECVIAGTVEAGEAGVIMDAANRSTPLPAFDRDELARFYEGESG
jgi:hydrogenase expression/formation protein HypE